MGFLDFLFRTAIPSISADELNARLKSDKRVILLDVRQPQEFEQGHIAGAKLIPLGELSRRMNELPTDREIVCVCASGNRSSSATKALVKAGYKAVNMSGGMFAWRRSKLPVKQK
ncbi:MAG: rhodanese-like domain-containing protein [Anaerolineales bacterium]|nr:rhodanese-like domain-containing protein [Anaerolineales bacterium]